ncbi:hypothetical protein DCO44_10715 [Acinetobacter sp. AM]|uniref:response regulator transcription factor n=1 Tax=Acinetobacter sp. AM TaxID=2170730 RepID=UPI000DE5D1CA|nr:response regulator transcription factor [Acinetobacter sp. AM]PWB14030.1 hypothetical protein DCO44_10715 [Acinetobacter sp. AM]
MNELLLPAPVLILSEEMNLDLRLRILLMELGYPAPLIHSTPYLDDALEIYRLHLPNIVLVDLNFTQVPLHDLIRSLKAYHPYVVIILLAPKGQTEQIFRGIQSGAYGYFFIEQTDREILQQIRTILRGGATLHGELAQYILNTQTQSQTQQFINHFKESPSQLFSDIELEILSLLANQLNTREIAHKLGIPLYSVEGRIKSIYRHLSHK